MLMTGAVYLCSTALAPCKSKNLYYEGFCPQCVGSIYNLSICAQIQLTTYYNYKEISKKNSYELQNHTIHLLCNSNLYSFLSTCQNIYQDIPDQIPHKS